MSYYQTFNCKYNQPMYIGLPNSTTLPVVQKETQQQVNTTNADSVSISANTTNDGLSTCAKWAIGIGAIAALAVGAVFLFRKGKPSKNIVDEFKPDANDVKIKQANTSNTGITTAPLQTEPPQIKIAAPKTAEQLKDKQSEKIKKYLSLEEAKNDFKMVANKSDFEAGKDYETLLKQLEKHNYCDDKSFINITSKSKHDDFRDVVIDAENHTLYKGVTMRPYSFDKTITPEYLHPDHVGSYLIKTLRDGRRVVGISVTAGRCDYVGRPIRSILTIISKDSEFTPIQKDLIEIISARSKDIKTARTSNGTNTDILSLGIIGNNDIANIPCFAVNEEILYSSISTAKKQLKNIDNDFITRALKGETLEHRVR